MKTLAEQIADILKNRAIKLKLAEEILTKSDGDLSTEEQTEFDLLTKDVEAFETKLGNLETLEKSQTKKFKLQAPNVLLNMHSLGKGGQREKGVFFARMAHALYVNDGNRQAAAAYVKSQFDDREMESVLKISDKQMNRLMTKAPTDGADTSVPEWAGALTVIREASSEFIDLLRPLSIMARIGARRMNFDGAQQIKIPRNSAGIVNPSLQPGEPLGGVYIGENKAIPVKATSFDNVILTPKKIAVITVSSTENLERSSPSLELLLRDDMLADTALVVDVKFNSSDEATAVAPGGIYFGIPAIPPSSESTPIENMMLDIQNLFASLRAANCSMAGLTLIMDPNNYNSLLFAQIDGVYLFRDELAGGTLFGATVLWSNTVRENFCSLVDASQIMIAEDQSPTIDVSEEAALEMSDTPSDDISQPVDGIVRSLWQSDMAAIRLRWRHDWGLRLDTCTAYILDTEWTGIAPLIAAKAKAKAKSSKV